MKKLLPALAALIVCSASCNKRHDTTANGITGEWERLEIYANDYWGSPSYWQPANDGTRIKFTADGKYYRRNATGTLQLQGTYALRDPNTIEITNAPSTSPSETFLYELETGSRLILRYNITEGTTQERFKRR
jgi:hypothetical protein